MAEAIDNIRQAYVIDDAALDQVHGFLLKFNDRVSYTIETQDGIRKRNLSKAQVKGYQNNPTSRMTSLGVHGNPITLFFNRDYIRYNISAPDDEIHNLRNQTVDFVSGFKPWWNVIARIPFFIVLLIGVLLSTIVFAFFLAIGVAEPDHSPDSPQENAREGLLIGLGLMVVGGVGWGLDWLKAKLFPMATFALGHGARRHQNREAFRRVALTTLVGLPVALLVGVVT